MSPVTRHRFRKTQHLLRPDEFKHVYDQRNVSRQRGMTVFAARNDLGFTRIGLSVSRKNGNAVQRNRIKRLFREAFRLQQDALPTGLDIILIPERERVPELREFQESLRRALQAIARRLQKAAESETTPPKEITPQAES